MLLSTLFENLSFGPLRDLAVGGSGSGVIPENQRPQIVVRVNHALSAIYTRFPLKHKTIRIETVSGRSQYPLRREFALTSDSTELNKFIKDTAADPFLGDVLMVESVANSENEALPFDDPNQETSWFKLSYDTLGVDNAKDEEPFFIRYQANHALLDPKMATLNTDIDIPRELESALFHHVAGNIFSGMGMEGAMAKAQSHLSMYESECAMFDTNNTFHQWSSPSGVREAEFRRKGWV